MEGENVILEEILHKIHEIKIGDYVDASDFLLKILSPSKPGEQDLLEDLRAGFRNRVIEPCFSKLEDIFQDLEKRHQSKDSQIYQLMDPLKSSDFQKYQQQVAKVLDQNLKTLKYPAASPIVSKILADPLNLVELSGLYQKKAKAVFDKQLDGLNTTIEIPKDSVQSAADTVSLGKNAKDVVPVAKNPIVNSSLENIPAEKQQADLKVNSSLENIPAEKQQADLKVNSSLENIPAEKQQADLNANNSWSIGAANNLLEKPVKEKQQANLEAEAIEVTLSEKSLKDLKELIIRGEESAKLFAHKNPKNSQENVPQADAGDAGGSGFSLTDALLAAAAAGKRLLPMLRLGGIVYVGYKAIMYAAEKAEEWKADTDKLHSHAAELLDRAQKGETSPEAKQRADEYHEDAKQHMVFKNYKPTNVVRPSTKEETREKLQATIKRLQIDSETLSSKLGNPSIGDRGRFAPIGEKLGEINETIVELRKIIDHLQDDPQHKPTIVPVVPPVPVGPPVPVVPPVPVNPQAQINIDGYKVVPPQLGSIESDKVFDKMDLEDISKQFSKVLSPMFGRMYDILASINDNTTGSGDNIVNNISSTANSSSGNSGPMQSGRDPIADFRANYWRDSSSSTRFTS